MDPFGVFVRGVSGVDGRVRRRWEDFDEWAYRPDVGDLVARGGQETEFGLASFQPNWVISDELGVRLVVRWR